VQQALASVGVTHGAVRLRAWIHRTPAVRVLRPRSPLAELAARSPIGRHGYGLLAGSRGGLIEFAAWCRIAAVSPHSVVHLPDDGRAWLPVWEGAPRERLDLVLARTDAAVRPAAWKAVRAGLSTGRPATLRSPAPRPTQEPGWDAPPRVLVAEHAATLFLTAPPRALFDLADAVTDATAEVPKLRDVRRHGEALLLGLAGSLHDDLEMDVLVRDERYRRR
jgi:hypothetical protein